MVFPKINAFRYVLGGGDGKFWIFRQNLITIAPFDAALVRRRWLIKHWCVFFDLFTQMYNIYTI